MAWVWAGRDRLAAALAAQVSVAEPATDPEGAEYRRHWLRLGSAYGTSRSLLDTNHLYGNRACALGNSLLRTVHLRASRFGGHPSAIEKLAWPAIRSSPNRPPSRLRTNAERRFGGQPSRGSPTVAHAPVGKRERRLVGLPAVARSQTGRPAFACIHERSLVGPAGIEPATP